MSHSADFEQLIRRMAAAIVHGNAAAATACFTPEGVYHDHFYGAFAGREAIERMITDCFYRDAADFDWQILDPCSDGVLGYARYDFAYTARIPGSEGRRVRYPGMLLCRLHRGLVAHYSEIFDRGLALVQLGFADARIVKSLRRAASH